MLYVCLYVRYVCSSLIFTRLFVNSRVIKWDKSMDSSFSKAHLSPLQDWQEVKTQESGYLPHNLLLNWEALDWGGLVLRCDWLSFPTFLGLGRTWGHKQGDSLWGRAGAEYASLVSFCLAIVHQCWWVPLTLLLAFGVRCRSCRGRVRGRCLTCGGRPVARRLLAASLVKVTC